MARDLRCMLQSAVAARGTVFFCSCKLTRQSLLYLVADGE